MIVFYAYGTLIEFSNLLSTILVALLVLERLRDSVSKKLEYLDDNIFLSLLHQLQGGELVCEQKEVRKAKDDLKRYGRFIVISLCPHSLVKVLEEFLLLHARFYDKFQQILSIAEKKNRFVSRSSMLFYLGFDISHSQPSSEDEKAYRELAKSIEQHQHSLVDETKTLFEKTKTKRKQAFEELEDFIKCNNLKLKEASFPSAY
jgi:hypothetical protein